MKTIEVTVKDPAGLHARPAGSLVRQARKYESRITLHRGENFVDASRLMAIMGLGIKAGETFCVTVDGPDEEYAAKELSEFFADMGAQHD